MPKKSRGTTLSRRNFIKQAAIGGALGSAIGRPEAMAGGEANALPGGSAKRPAKTTGSSQAFSYPRVFSGRSLKTIAFPLGGIGTGTISLGGRGQLRDWEIFNRPDKGNSPKYCFPAIWVQVEGKKPVARVLEAQIDPPYGGPSGLGSNNVPGLPRLSSATFTGAYPFARVAFQDDKLPVSVELEAFNPLVPLDVEASGWPIAVLRYRIRNRRAGAAKLGVAYSLENPVGEEGRQANFRSTEGVSGLLMDNPFMASAHALKGSVFMGVLGAPEGSVTYLRGWKRTQWWDGPLSFWDDFTDDGALTTDSRSASPVGSIAVTQPLPAHGEASVTFLFAWRFPNRTPDRCGWPPPSDDDKQTVVGNHYCQQFADAFEIARQVARDLPALEERSRKFSAAVESSTLPPVALDAALSNLSILRTNTAFRSADGEFHGFEGCDDQSGCCHGSCTHVWNYEQATAFVFPSLARSVRESEFLRNTRADGLMGFRSYLPDGKKIWDRAAADGQMGCLMKLYRDWQLSGNTEWLRSLWPQAKKALEFAWIKGGWDGNRDGVAEGVQHNTYDVEFYGPNPLCGIWYLGALRAGEEMARAVGDQPSAAEYQRLFENGSKWIDANLFNGEYYIQKVEGRPKEEVADGLMIGMGAADPQKPDYQMGVACLVDQLLGQYMAHVAGLGYLVDPQHVATTLKSIFRYNYIADLSEHEAVQRTYALNDDAGVLVASYPSGNRPEIPFPYFAEVWTGLEYQFAAHLVYEGMTDEALTVVEAIRRRHDGERRNPWDEPECGHHYARAMSSWAVLVALSGFHYSAVERHLKISPRVPGSNFQSFWSAPGGWGSYSRTIKGRQQTVKIEVSEGKIALARLSLARARKGSGKNLIAQLGGEPVKFTLREDENNHFIEFDREIQVSPGHALDVTVGS
jgi:non-lysosomal glucosylceramidase